jgi:hypothetical protein
LGSARGVEIDPPPLSIFFFYLRIIVWQLSGKAGNRKQKIKNRKQKVENRKWRTKNGKWRTENGKQKTEHRE